MQFTRLQRESILCPTLDEDTFYRLQWAVHEWMANLVQHASFEDRSPEICLSLIPESGKVTCTIDDNSSGFDLARQLNIRPELLDPFPERGMGLIILESCAQELSYKRLTPTQHRLKFIVSIQQDPWINIPFS